MTAGAAERPSALPDDYVAARRAVDQLVRSVPASCWSAVTPCPDWTVRDLVGHLVDGQNLLCRLADGTPWTTEPDPGQLVGDDPVGAWSAAMAGADARLDAAALGTVVTTPAGESVLGTFLDQRVSMELLVHAWDLARAIGLSAPHEDDLARRIHARIVPFDEQIRGPRRYGPRQYTTSTNSRNCSQSPSPHEPSKI